MGSNTYGMLLGDRVVWLTLGLILLMGAAWFGAGLYGMLFTGGIGIFIFTENNFLGIDGASFFVIPVLLS